MKNPRGFTLIEMSFVIAIIGLLLVAAGTKLRDYAVESSGEKLGNEAATLLGSVNTYTAQYFEEIMNGTAVPGVANNLTPTIAELKVVGGLSASFPVKNSQNTGWTIRIDNRVPAGCVPPACDIESLVSTDAGILDLDGTGVPALKVLGSAMKRMESNGVRAGISDETAPGTISGQGASWTAPNPAGNVAGVLAAKGGFGSSGYSQFVRMGDSRDVTLSGALTVNGANGVTATKVASNGTLTVAGQTTLTGAATVNSNLAVNGTTTLKGTSATTLNTSGAITTASLTATGNVQGRYLLPSQNITAGTACSTNGLIAKDATGSAFVCVSSVWTSSSSKPCVHGSWVSPSTGLYSIAVPSECTNIVISGFGGAAAGAYGQYGALAYSSQRLMGGVGGGSTGLTSVSKVISNSFPLSVFIGAGGRSDGQAHGVNGQSSYVNQAGVRLATFTGATGQFAGTGGSNGQSKSQYLFSIAAYCVGYGSRRSCRYTFKSVVNEVPGGAGANGANGAGGGGGGAPTFDYCTYRDDYRCLSNRQYAVNPGTNGGAGTHPGDAAPARTTPSQTNWNGGNGKVTISW